MQSLRPSPSFRFPRTVDQGGWRRTLWIGSRREGGPPLLRVNFSAGPRNRPLMHLAWCNAQIVRVFRALTVCSGVDFHSPCTENVEIVPAPLPLALRRLRRRDVCSLLRQTQLSLQQLPLGDESSDLMWVRLVSGMTATASAPGYAQALRAGVQRSDPEELPGSSGGRPHPLERGGRFTYTLSPHRQRQLPARPVANLGSPCRECHPAQHEVRTLASRCARAWRACRQRWPDGPPAVP